jgi:putative DNA primase/helicase
MPVQTLSWGLGMSKKISASKKQLLAWAFRCIKRGWHILPLKSPIHGDPRSGKKPDTLHGVSDATNNSVDFKKLVQGRQTFNLGLATGKKSGIVIFDIDPQNGGEKTFKTFQRNYGAAPATVEVKTGGGGRHLYFLAPVQELKSCVLGNGIDFLAEGKYAVMPPSIHGSGGRYLFARGKSPKKIAVAPLPEAWLEAILNRTAVPKSGATIDDGKIPEGRRNTELTRIAGSLRRQGFSEELILSVIKQVNENRCEPPLDDEEVVKIAESVCRYAPDMENGDLGQQIAEIILSAQFDDGNWLRYEADGQFWVWKETHWHVLPDILLQQRILHILNEIPLAKKKATKDLVKNVFALLQIRQAREGDGLHFASEPPPVINVRNGELWLLNDGSVELRPHNPTTGMRNVLSVTYDPKALCDEYDKALNQIFSRAEDPKALVKCFNELVVYTIQPRRFMALIVLLLGNGSNGKSALMKLLTHMVGPSFIFSGRVSELENDKNAIGSLDGKFAFIDDDVSAGTKLPDGALKKLSESKLLTGQHKYKNLFSFVNRAFPILLCNNLPSLSDVSYGMRRRLQIFPFDKKFSKKEIDPNLIDRIIQNELAGVLNRVLEGWKRLSVQGRLSSSPDMQKARRAFLANSNPLMGFIEEKCVVEPGAKVSLSDFQKAYELWAEESGYTKTQAKSTIKKNLEHQGFTIKRHGPGLMVIGVRIRKP